MKLDNLFTAEELTAAVLNMNVLSTTKWIEVCGSSYSYGIPSTDKIQLRIKVENNDFCRQTELHVSDLVSDEKMEAFWKLAREMHAETRDEAIERRLKALEGK